MSYSRPPPNVGDLISLKVDNLTDRISRRTLRRIFERYGPVGDVYIPRDRFTLESRGFVAAAGPAPGADRHVRPDLASAAPSLHLAPVTVRHHPQCPDLSQQPRLGLDSEAFHQEESTGPEDNQKNPSRFPEGEGAVSY
ncbi:hypothetical protein G4228_019780 [Cervus hanglu yarkandensis]|uniref:RRM domain-containing protein n=1 Tax=Cervus hanglu yarkandensis TaxID=84702 RepID=A0A833W304_9CERV|nr:hypothetical protein G4228_019780 [Cervus hanglu yarkandensis]